jgi:PAS domain S-box-containing protein
MEKEFKAEINASRIEMENALQNSSVSISQQDTQLRYTHFFNTHNGMAAGDLIGKTDADWLPAGEAKRLTSIKRRALEGKSGIRELFVSTVLGGAEKGVYYNEIKVEPIIENGKVAGVYTVAIDITEYHQALRKLEALNGRLLKHMETQLGHPNQS